MFCSKCGQPLQADEKVCPQCGNPVSQNKVGDQEKINFKEFLTMENIERFAPIAAFLPIAMFLIIHVLFKILKMIVFDWLGVYTIVSVIATLLNFVFIVASIAATAGLVYVVLKKKNPSNINSWVAPIACLLATISCILLAKGSNLVPIILGLIAVILGLELLARVVINGQPMETPMNFGGAMETYKKYFGNYKSQYPTSKELEKTGYVDPENSKFDGSGLELLGYNILKVLVCAITCGIATPWMICKINKWKLSHTVINGKRLTFTGTGGSLLGHWILWTLLTVITCGIYGFFMHVALRKWELKHTYIEGEPIVANGNESYFDGNSMAYFGYGLLSGLLLTITCSLSFPWVMAMLQKWDTKHQVINNRRLQFSGTGLGFLGEYLIILILSVITCGIYAPWGTVRMYKYIIRNTDFVN